MQLLNKGNGGPVQGWNAQDHLVFAFLVVLNIYSPIRLSQTVSYEMHDSLLIICAQLV